VRGAHANTATANFDRRNYETRSLQKHVTRRASWPARTGVNKLTRHALAWRPHRNRPVGPGCPETAGDAGYDAFTPANPSGSCCPRWIIRGTFALPRSARLTHFGSAKNLRCHAPEQSAEITDSMRVPLGSEKGRPPR